MDYIPQYIGDQDNALIGEGPLFKGYPGGRRGFVSGPMHDSLEYPFCGGNLSEPYSGTINSIGVHPGKAITLYSGPNFSGQHKVYRAGNERLYVNTPWPARSITTDVIEPNEYDLEWVFHSIRPPMGHSMCRIENDYMDILVFGTVVNHHRMGDSKLGRAPIFVYDGNTVTKAGYLPEPSNVIEATQSLFYNPESDFFHVAPEDLNGRSMDYSMPVGESFDPSRLHATNFHEKKWGNGWYVNGLEVLAYGDNRPGGVIIPYRGGWHKIKTAAYPTGIVYDPSRNIAVVSQNVSGRTGIWRWNLANDNLEHLASFDGWRWIDGHYWSPENNLLLLLGGGQKIPWWASFGSPRLWRKVTIYKPVDYGVWREASEDEFEGGYYDLCIHPVTGRPILWAAGAARDYSLAAYEGWWNGFNWVFYEVAWKPHCAGAWSMVSKAYKDAVYMLTGDVEPAPGAANNDEPNRRGTMHRLLKV